MPFRAFYANDKDYLISDCLFYFFNAIAHSFPDLWNYDGVSKPQNILQSTVGFESLLNLMSDILIKDNIETFDTSTFKLSIDKIKNINFADSSLYPMSSRGKRILYLSMALKLYPDEKLQNELELLLSK